MGPPEPNFWRTKAGRAPKVGSSTHAGALPSFAGDNPFELGKSWCYLGHQISGITRGFTMANRKDLFISFLLDKQVQRALFRVQQPPESRRHQWLWEYSTQYTTNHKFTDSDVLCRSGRRALRESSSIVRSKDFCVCVAVKGLNDEGGITR